MATPQSILATRTTTRLLDALHEQGNEPLWIQIDARYRPVITALARRLGAGDADADEVAQQTMSEFVRAYRGGRYDRSKGRLSSWILGIAHNITLHTLRNARREITPGSTTLANQVDQNALREIWNQERDRAIFTRALDTLRAESAIEDRTLLAFELVSLRGVPTSEVARQCGMSVDQVYVAKSRVVTQLRSIVQELTSAFEEDA